jgi:predicted metal-dependent HD superfamily phosphohydrolase
MNLVDELEHKWYHCWQDLPTDQTELDRVLKLIINAYTQPDRHYHNLTHIHQVLMTLDRFSGSIDNPIVVSLAGWFHDFIYDSQASDNELQSAKAAGELLTNLGLPCEQIDRVQELIMATQGHQIIADDLDRCIFLDADLAILGTEPDRYQAYSRSIRLEYSWISDLAYQAGRTRVLESFLQRDRLYYTEILFGELESIARQNLQAEIDRLNNLCH